MQSIANTNRNIKTHTADRTLTSLKRSDTRLRYTNLVGELLLCHATLQSEFPQTHASILP